MTLGAVAHLIAPESGWHQQADHDHFCYQSARTAACVLRDDVDVPTQLSGLGVRHRAHIVQGQTPCASIQTWRSFCAILAELLVDSDGAELTALLLPFGDDIVAPAQCTRFYTRGATPNRRMHAGVFTVDMGYLLSRPILLLPYFFAPSCDGLASLPLVFGAVKTHVTSGIGGFNGYRLRVGRSHPARRWRHRRRRRMGFVKALERRETLPAVGSQTLGCRAVDDSDTRPWARQAPAAQHGEQTAQVFVGPRRARDTR